MESYGFDSSHLTTSCSPLPTVPWEQSPVSPPRLKNGEFEMTLKKQSLPSELLRAPGSITFMFVKLL